MRKFIFIFIVALSFTISVSAQNTLTNRAFETGTRAAQAKNYEKAIADYRRAILFSETEKQSNDFLARIHFNVGVCLYNLKQPDKAVEEFTEAIKLSRRNYQKAFYALGMAHKDLRNWQKAEIAFRRAIELKTDDGEAWFDLAFVFLRQENFDQAEKAFQKSIKHKSVGTADAHNNLGVIFALRHEFDSAENEFQTALEVSNGKSILARNNLQFCKSYKRNSNQNLLARLEFSKTK
jgi:tetratricopeptide (TPR) repeat protein